MGCESKAKVEKKEALLGFEWVTVKVRSFGDGGWQQKSAAEPVRSKNVGGDRRHRSTRPAGTSLAQRVRKMPCFAGRCEGGGAVPQGAGVPTCLLLTGAAVLLS